MHDLCFKLTHFYISQFKKPSHTFPFLYFMKLNTFNHYADDNILIFCPI
jgi:hypothetical protein